MPKRSTPRSTPHTVGRQANQQVRPTYQATNLRGTTPKRSTPRRKAGWYGDALTTAKGRSYMARITPIPAKAVAHPRQVPPPGLQARIRQIRARPEG